MTQRTSSPGVPRLMEISVPRRWFILCWTVIAQGCAANPQQSPGDPLASARPTHLVNVNGFASGPGWSPLPSSTFAVIATPDANALFAEEVKEKVERLLLDQNRPVSTPDDADYLVFVQFGIGPPEDPGPSGQSQVLSLGTFPRMSFSRYVPVPGGEYFRWLVVGVAEAAPFRLSDRNPRPVPWVWIGESDSTGRSTDLRYMIDFLLVPTLEALGLNTVDRAAGTIPDDVPKVARLKFPVTIDPPNPTVESLFGPIQFRALAFLPSGRPLELGEVRWASADTAVLVVGGGGDGMSRRPGTVSVGASAEVVATGRFHLASTQVTVRQVPVGFNKIRGEGQIVPALEAAPVDPTVQVLDAQGYPIQGVTVRFEVPEGGRGAVSLAEVSTNADGLASTRWTAAGSGQQTLHAVMGNQIHTFTVTVRPERR